MLRWKADPSIAMHSIIHKTGDKRCRGMTLVEILMASAISLIVVGGAMWLIIEGMATAMKTSNVSGNDLTHWGMSNRLVFDTRTATELVVYTDFSTGTITAEGETGIRSYETPRIVGNFLVLALRLPDKESGVWACSKLTGYVFDPNAQTLSKFEYTIDTTSEDYTKGRTIPELLIKYHSSFKLQPVSASLALPALAAGGSTTGAFYWPALSSGNASSKAIMRVCLGDGKQHWRVRDTRLIEVAFYIRS